ncbi:MAG: nucleotidyltransferase domain-containing protein [Magnetococcales bacterium]|nr:nucleotidyltransferase domain-containing protein [Magnetococcales bacterium]
MRHGLTADTVERIQGVLTHFPAVERALLYGSRARGDHKPGSDIDLTLCEESLISEQLAAIALELDDLMLPYTFDLSILDRLDHAALRRIVAREGVILYERQPRPVISG